MKGMEPIQHIFRSLDGWVKYFDDEDFDWEEAIAEAEGVIARSKNFNVIFYEKRIGTKQVHHDMILPK